MKYISVWVALAVLIAVSVWFLAPFNPSVVIEGALFTAVFLLLIRLQHSFGVGSPIVLPSIVATCLTMFRFSRIGMSAPFIFPLVCFLGYCFLGCILLIALAFSGKKPFRQRMYNGVFSCGVSWGVTGMFLSWFSPLQGGTFLGICLGYVFLGVAMGCYITVATQSRSSL